MRGKIGWRRVKLERSSSLDPAHDICCCSTKLQISTQAVPQHCSSAEMSHLNWCLLAAEATLEGNTQNKFTFQILRWPFLVFSVPFMYRHHKTRSINSILLNKGAGQRSSVAARMLPTREGCQIACSRHHLSNQRNHHGC